MSGFGEWLKAKRAELDLSYRGLAKLSGVSASYIRQIEVDEWRGAPKPDKLKKLAPALLVSYDRLMEIAGYTKAPADLNDNGIAYVKLVEGYMQQGLSEDEIRKTLDAIVAYANYMKSKKGEK